MNKFFLFFVVLIISISGFSQQYNFISYSVEEGLAQSQIRAICQDEDGYLWIGTLGGISKFDGLNFENFSTDDGLLNNQINSIFNDSKGNVWIGSRGGVSVYDGNTFKNYKFKNELSQNVVLSIAEDQLNRIWFATNGAGMVYLEDAIFNYLPLPNGTKSNYIRSIAIDDKDNIWLATKSGLTVIDSEHHVKDSISGVNATHVFVDTDKSIWCSTYGNGVFHLTEGLNSKHNTSSGLISNHIRGFVKRKDGSFWFVSKFGISKYHKGKVENFTAKDGLKNSNIKVVLEDDEGNLFFGSDGGGLIKFTSEDFISYTEEGVIGSNVVMSVLEDFDTNIWVSTYGKGVGVFKDEGFVSYTTEDGLRNNTVWCSMVAEDKKIWVGTDDGIAVFDGNKFKAYALAEGLIAKKVFAIKDDFNNNIWIGTTKGVSVLNKLNDSISNLGIAKNVRDFFVENEKDIWFCSSDGLFKYNVHEKTYKVYTEEDGLQTNSVMRIVKGKNEEYWIGTANGLSLLSNDKIKNIKIPWNYAANNINFLELDEFDNLWIGTNFGLYQLNVSNKDSFESTDFIRYSNHDGLKSLECNQNASCIDSKNNLWFGTSYGLMKHKVNAEKSIVTLPKVQLQDIRLFFEKKDLTKYAKGYDNQTNLPNDLELGYNKNHLTFDFVGVYHTYPDKVKYRFKLDGFDEAWQPITASRFVTYSNIPSGDFTFKLSATTDLKNWTKPVSFSFSIKPAFWFTWWFYLFCVVLVSFIAWVLAKRKIKKDEDKRSTQLIIDKAKMLELEQQALNSSMNRHFIFNALNSIQYYINRQDRIAANKYLSSFAKLVRKNLDSSLVNEIYLDDEIERIRLYLKLEEMRFQDKFDYEVNVDIMIEPQSIKIPSMLLQPFIENSIWHGILPRDKKGSINIDVQKKEGKLIIKIVDDGIGIDESRARKESKIQHHASKGMDLTKGRINLISKVSKKDCAIKGPYQIYNKKKEIAGTEVSIVLTL